MVFGHKKTPSNWIVQLLGVTSLRGFFAFCRSINTVLNHNLLVLMAVRIKASTL
jgi:hypothetical protein